MLEMHRRTLIISQIEVDLEMYLQTSNLSLSLGL